MKFLISLSIMLMIGSMHKCDYMHLQKSDIIRIDTSRHQIILSKAGIGKMKTLKRSDIIVWLDEKFLIEGQDDALFPPFPVLTKNAQDPSQIFCFYQIDHLPLKKQEKIKASIRILIFKLGLK